MNLNQTAKRRQRLIRLFGAIPGSLFHHAEREAYCTFSFAPGLRFHRSLLLAVQ
jgi:hypothetical protein